MKTPMCEMCMRPIEPEEDYSVFGRVGGDPHIAHDGLCHVAFLYCLAAHDRDWLDSANMYRAEWLVGDGYLDAADATG